MFGWLFGKKEKKSKQAKKRKTRRLRSYDDLAAEFFAMWPADQTAVLKALGVPKPESTIDYARPCATVEYAADIKRQESAPMTPGDFLGELREQLSEGRRIQVVAVFQQIFRDLREAESYVDSLEDQEE